MSKETNKFDWGKIIFIALLLIIALAFCEELGITSFTRNSSPDPIQHINVDKWDGSFTGYSGPCHYVETYSGIACDCPDWTVKGSSSSGICRCGHGTKYHY